MEDFSNDTTVTKDQSSKGWFFCVQPQVQRHLRSVRSCVTSPISKRKAPTHAKIWQRMIARVWIFTEKMGVRWDCVSGSPNGNVLKIGPQCASQIDRGNVLAPKSAAPSVLIFANQSATRPMFAVLTLFATSYLQRNVPVASSMKATNMAIEDTVRCLDVVGRHPCALLKTPPVPAARCLTMERLRLPWMGTWRLRCCLCAVLCVTRRTPWFQVCLVLTWARRIAAAGSFTKRIGMVFGACVFLLETSVQQIHRIPVRDPYPFVQMTWAFRNLCAAPVGMKHHQSPQRIRPCSSRKPQPRLGRPRWFQPFVFRCAKRPTPAAWMPPVKTFRRRPASRRSFMKRIMMEAGQGQGELGELKN